MNAQIAALKQAAETARDVYEAEKARLTEQGLNSKARYEALKTLKADLDVKWAAHVDAVNGAIRKECRKIIAADAPRRRAEKLARSPWKQAKAAAGL